MAISVEYNYLTGHPSSEVFEALNRSIGQYKRNHSELKIGMTGQKPEDRAKQHDAKKHGWKRMVVIYQTTSEGNTIEVEKVLIDKHWSDIENEVSGGGGKLREKGLNYIYVLIK